MTKEKDVNGYIILRVANNASTRTGEIETIRDLSSWLLK
jgi:hypothetical protein